MSEGSRGDLKILAVILVAGLGLLVLAFVFGGPLLAQASAALAPGLGIKQAAVWGFGVTFVMFIVFAIAAGDGLIGEIQFMLVGFFLFFVIITLLIAWVF
ncbi:MAG: hypothetical protein PVF91_08545 [Chromatiales bacterium]|jgi:hypothetical protein